MNMPYTVETITARFDRMLAETRARKDRLAEWAAAKNIPYEKLCDRHKVLQRIDLDLSVAKTHANDGKSSIVYTPCKGCVQEAEIAKASLWLQARGVPDNMLHCDLRGYQSRAPGDKEAAEKIIEKRKGFLVLLGEWGLGKTHLAIAIMREFRSGWFITNDELLLRLRKTYRSDYAEDPLERAKRVGILVLDEVGVSAGGKDEMPMIYSILSHRHNEKLPTVMTGNLSMEQFKEFLGPRLVDRLSESALKILPLKGESMRKKKSGEYFA